MTSLQIKYFLKVSDTMSFTQAAAELYVSQPSVSRQVKLLEEELGFPLFDRTRKNLITLTPAGMVFRESFQSAAKGFEQASAAARELAAHAPRPLRMGIGAGWDFSTELAHAREQVLRQYPQAELHFESGNFLSLREQLRANILDAILCTKTSILDFTGLDVLPVASLEPRAYVRRGLLRPEDEPLQIEDFENQTLFMLSEEEAPMAMELVRMQFQAHQVMVNPVWLPNRETILQAVLMGDGFTVFDQYVYFRSDPRLTYTSLEELIPLCFIQNKSNAHPLTASLAQSLTEQMQQHP